MRDLVLNRRFGRSPTILWAELMLWPQSHLAGYEMLKARPDLRERLEKLLGAKLTVNSHAVEYVGVYFSWNHVDDSDPMLAAIHEIMAEEFEIAMSDPPLRPIIRELVVSRSANSSFWRFPLQHAFFALELGETDDLVADSCSSRPSKRNDAARSNGMMPPTITR